MNLASIQEGRERFERKVVAGFARLPLGKLNALEDGEDAAETAVMELL